LPECADSADLAGLSNSIAESSADGTRWEYAGQLRHPRFFHRVLPANESALVIAGGASMTDGKIVELERVAAGVAASAP